MSDIVPKTQDGLLDWYSQHQPKWESAGAAIGVDPALSTALKDLVETAKIAKAARIDAKASAKSATVTYKQSLANLSSLGAAIMATIRAYAEATDDVTVYAKADIPPPAKPTPAPPPLAPTEFTADPNANGTITLRMKGSVAQNGSFDIERSIDGGPYTLLKNTREKTYVDNAVPTNSTIIAYQCYGVRDSKRSADSASTTVLFGNLPAALQAAFRSGPEKLAA